MRVIEVRLAGDWLQMTMEEEDDDKRRGLTPQRLENEESLLLDSLWPHANDITPDLSQERKPKSFLSFNKLFLQRGLTILI